MKLSFTTASGESISSFTLHAKTKARTMRRSNNPAEARMQQEERLTAIEPGMNAFQWDLRSPDAVEVKGIYNTQRTNAPPIGPEVVPGTYYATLTYGNTTAEAAI